MRQKMTRWVSLLGLVGLLLCSCQAFQEDLALVDLPGLPNLLFDLKCGDYTFHTFSTQEKCGGQQDSFGFLYEEDKVVKIILDPTEGDETSLYIPTFTILLHTDYLKAGQTLDKTQVIATCSRFRKELALDNPTYYTEPAESVVFKVVSHKGEQTHRILDDHTQWEFEWDIQCPRLTMTAKGKDQIDISRNPTPSRWKQADGGTLPPAPGF